MDGADHLESLSGGNGEDKKVAMYADRVLGREERVFVLTSASAVDSLSRLTWPAESMISQSYSTPP